MVYAQPFEVGSAVLLYAPDCCLTSIPDNLPDFPFRSALTPQEIIRLEVALKNLDFDIRSAEGEGPFVLNKLAEMLTLLTLQERGLILTLLEDFLHCSYVRQMPLITSALKLIPATRIQGFNQAILLPLAETGSDGKSKSSAGLPYIAEYHLLPFVPAFAGVNVVHYDKMESLNTHQQGRSTSLILLFDDFVGGGGTAVKSIQRYRNLYKKPGDRLAVVVAAAQQQGINRITRENVDTFAAVVRTKGISESSVISNRAAALALMDSIEARLGVVRKYKRGFARCEALVKMIRAPNNTFPIFWEPTTRSGELWPAPFGRYR